MKQKIILGISTGHGDSSAALIVEGKCVAAVEEERFRRVKHYAMFPELAIKHCLRHAGLEPSAVEAVAIARKPRANFFRKFLMSWQHPTLLTTKRHRGQTTNPISLEASLKAAGLRRASVFSVEHHYAHLMTSRVLCPHFDVSLLSFDGLGDFVSAAIARPQGEGLVILDRVYFPHSIGYFYTAMTQYLGFPYFGDEYKMMGLSSLGAPKYVGQLRELIKEEHSRFGFELNLEAFPLMKLASSFTIENSQPKIAPIFNSNLLTQLLGIRPRKPTETITQAHMDLAKSAQARFEEIANHCLRQLHSRHPTETIALSGGCAHNSVWVGKIPQATPFKHVFVAPASHDAGISLGAALSVAQREVKPESGHWGLLGPDASEVGDEGASVNPSAIKEWNFSSTKELIDWMVQALMEKKIIGFFHGRMEFGPRALGSRSILADPRWPEMKDRLNRRIKHRETFRPFAASVLMEFQNEWFVDSFPCPSMEAVFQVKQPTRIPAVTHADNSCRIQSVTRETQPFYFDLIDAFRQKTGVPMLINTSFNDSEPIVCAKADAWRCFLATDLDALVIDDKIYTKTAQSVGMHVALSA